MVSDDLGYQQLNAEYRQMGFMSHVGHPNYTYNFNIQPRLAVADEYGVSYLRARFRSHFGPRPNNKFGDTPY